MTTGEKIKTLRLKKGMTQEELAQRLGVKVPAVYKYETGLVVNLKRSTIANLAEALDCSPAYLMGWEDEFFPSNIMPMPGTRRVPRLGMIACGEPLLAEQNIESYDEVPDYIKCDFTLVCKGDSMINARIYDGDIVCIKEQQEVQNGQIAAVCVDGEFESEATLKRVRYIKDGIMLEAANPKYDPFVFAGEDANRVRILGLATHFISRVEQ